jgi:hypothetical protein
MRKKCGAVVLDVQTAITWEREELFFRRGLTGFLPCARGGEEDAARTIREAVPELPHGKFGTDPERLAFAINPKEVFSCRADSPCRYEGKKTAGRAASGIARRNAARRFSTASTFSRARFTI